MEAKAAIAVVLGVLLSTNAVEAQSLGAGRGEQAGQQTKFQVINRPLQALLDDGYEIRSIDSGMFLVGKPGSPWALCNVLITNGMMSNSTDTTTTRSICRALN